MTIQYKDANILLFDENIMIQQVNFQGVMGAGLALKTKNIYKGCYDRYLQYCKHNTWDSIKNNGIYVSYSVSENPHKELAFVFGQLNYGNDRCQTDYISLENGLKNIAEYARYLNYSIAIPFKIGCGLAGGDWNIVLPIIEKHFWNIFRHSSISGVDYNYAKDYFNSRSCRKW